ncbi:carboxylate-amine ligase [Rubrobacter indicoceani]|uniref:carboxylate-amine ligase n=1 Tax=Rubrobacter indicoceani TaxID=2051957 RepID=UPI000E5B6460|nr:YbdK family carboxylate-amine ligase [Rubrobacter indicoceani]
MKNSNNESAAASYAPLKEALVPADAFEQPGEEGTLGAEEELWLADPDSGRLAGGAQSILEAESDREFSGELIDCEIEANTAPHPDPSGVASDLRARREVLLGHAEGLGRLLGTSGTQPLGDWREQTIIDKPHYQRLKGKLGWLIRRNNTFSLHVHYAVKGKEKSVYLFDRLREYVPHLLALSVNSPFWQGEFTEMHSSRILVFSRSIHRAGLPEPLGTWENYEKYVNFARRSSSIHSLSEIWWDVRPHPGLGTMEVRAFDSQSDVQRSEALITLTAAVCDMLCREYESGDLQPIRPSREIEENKWSAQRYGLNGNLSSHDTHESSPTKAALEDLISRAAEASGRDLTPVENLLSVPTESELQLEVWRETDSLLEVVRDISRRTTAPVRA